jgi:glycosyltransferase involved in cell wall biosynthesis
MLAIGFWLSLLFVFYAYCGYPAALLALRAVRRRTVHKGEITPHVSVIITAHNEARRLPEKLENTLQLLYPPDRLEVLVASDCSTDDTDAIALAYRHRGVTLVRPAERKGKEHAQKHAVDRARGEILVFSDAGTLLEPEGLRHLVASFADPTVGCVSSVDRVLDAQGKLSGEGAYVRYEMWLRGLESSVNSLVGLSGSLFGARRAVCAPWRTDLQSDFNTLLNAVRHGLRGVSDPAVIGYYRNIAVERRELDRKIRTVVRGIAVLMNNLSLLNPLRHGLFAWQLFSHKVCRWLVPACLPLALLTNVALLPRGLPYTALLVAQLVFYALACLPLVTRPSFRGAWRLPSYFVATNLAIALAWVRYLRGERFVFWQPSER